MKLSPLTISTYSLDHTSLWWTVEDKGEDYLLYTLYVERSESIAGPYDTISPPLKDIFNFVDYGTPKRTRFRRFYYRLRVVRDLDAYEEHTEAQTLQAPPDLKALEIQRRKYLELHEFAGRLAVIFPRPTFGPRCPQCYDKARSRSTLDNCATCYGTSYAIGYHRPFEMPVKLYRASEEVMFVTKRGNTEGVMHVGETLAFPLLKPGDVVVERENLRHVVEKTSFTERLRCPITQRLYLSQLSEGHVAYKLEVPVDEEQYQVSPRRELKPRASASEEVELSDTDLDLRELVFSRGGPL